ncbi:MAG: cell division FtsA domain-containing protein [Candidatus Omnitrophica bacterium]|nr:cell division FtsA domain-containing protein [Candidatus Omnitrophota bacterium]
MLNRYVCGVDISSSKIAAAVAPLKNGRIADIFFEEAPSKGIKKGVIVDAIDLVGELGGVLKKLKEKSQIRIKSVQVNISARDLVARHSRAVIPLAEKGNKVITLSDVLKVNEQARILGSSLEEEIVHAIPFGYTIDSRESVMNPLGLYSHRLEVDLYLMCARLSAVQNISRAVNQAGYAVGDMAFSGIASAGLIFGEGLKEGVCVLCDIGSDITEIVVFQDGMLKDVAVVYTGGDDLTLELQETLGIPFELAEEVKRSYASIGAFDHISEDKEILIKKESAYRPIKQKAVCQALTQKTGELCAGIKEALQRIVPLEGVNNFRACGRSVLLEGFLESLESTLGIPVKLAKISHPQVASFANKDANLTGQKYLSFITTLGLITRSFETEAFVLGARTQSSPLRNPFQKTVNKLKEIYQEYF